MNNETKDTAKLILAEIAKARNYSELPTPHDLFISSEAIISGMAYLIGPLMDAETAYRSKVDGFIGEKMSAAAAEAKAKAGIEYAEWKKLERTYNLAEQQLMILKKFKDDLQMEFKRS